MNIKGPRYNSDGTIDIDIEHPMHGWIAFTASPDDVEESGRLLYEEAIAGDFGQISPYEAP